MNLQDYLNPHDEYDPTAEQIMFTPSGRPTLQAEVGGIIVTQALVTIITQVKEKTKVASRILSIAEDESIFKP